MYRRSLRPRWREITASVLVIAVLLPAAGFLAEDASGPGIHYLDELQGEDLRGIDLVWYG
ncbi:MAG: hypothetical protein ACI9JL_000255 [Paracoccaceae bacterium]|jgi:hypothetical protein